MSGSDAAIDWAVASRPMPGEAVLGDAYLVQQRGPRVVVAVVDGLGHGAEAAQAARAAVRAMEDGGSPSPDALLEQCHRALRSTRGAAIALASLDSAGSRLCWLSIGNVDGVVLRAGAGGGPAHRGIRQRGGVVGHSLPPVQAETIDWRAGDLLVLASDGIKQGFAQERWSAGPAVDFARRILARHARGTDDALVLAVRNLGHRG